MPISKALFLTTLVLSFEHFLLCFGQIQFDSLDNLCQSNGWDFTNLCCLSSGTYCHTCNSENIFGKFFSNTYLQKTYLLPSHNKISINAQFWSATWMSSPYFYVVADNQLLLQTNFGSVITSTGCGSIKKSTLSKIFNHQSKTLTIYLFGYDYYWGIQSFSLYYYECEIQCLYYYDQNGKCNKYQLIYEIDFGMNLEGWLLNDSNFINTYQDKNLQLIGPFHIGDIIKKKFQLDAPSFLFIRLKVITQNFSQYSIRIFIDSALLMVSVFDGQVINKSCGDYQTNKFFETQSLFQQNIMMSIQIEIKLTSTSSCSATYFGISEFQIFRKLINDDFQCDDVNLTPFDGCFFQQYQCSDGCEFCIKGQCQQCLDNWILDEINQMCIPVCGDRIITSFEECDDGNYVQYDGCFQCKFQCRLNCKKCEFGQCLDDQIISTELSIQNEYLELLKNQKFYQNIISDYFQQNLNSFNMVQYQFHQVIYFGISQINQLECLLDQCRHDYIIVTESISQSNYNIINEYQELINYYNYPYFQTTDYSNQNFNQLEIIKLQFHFITFFDDSKVDQSNSIQSIYKIDKCLLQKVNKCSVCQDGYQLNFYKNQCIPKCDDGIAQRNEICDDQNNIQFDGCYHCESNCSIQCLICENSKCLSCGFGWSLVNNQCEALCGDGQIAQESNELCDDMNYQAGDGCYNCKTECTSNCLACMDINRCFLCDEYFQLSQDNQFCQPICGDGYVVLGLEDCEDGNDIPYDGCYYCQFDCDPKCQICKQGECQDACQQGLYLIDFVCKSICGDKIVAGDEECDDGNDIEFDGCHKCLSSCVDSCTDCSFGQCYSCQKGLILTNNICQDICGNGRKDQLEECDDGNNFNLDGCSSLCLIENGWDCISYAKQSYCEKKLTFTLNYLNKTYDLQFVQLQFPKPVILDEQSKQLTEQMKFEIKDLNPEYYQIKKEVLIEIQKKELKQAEYLFIIQYTQSVQQPIFEVTITSQIYDINDFQLEIPTVKSIPLKSIAILSQEQITKAISFQVLGKYIILGLAVSSGLIFLFGKPSDSLEILDQLQYQSYLRYINIQFPQNLMIYFESSDQVTINPILEFFGINKFLSQTIQEQFLESFGKFSEYQLNADLLSNISGQISQIGFLIVICVFIYFYKRFYYKNCFSSRIFYEIRLLKSKKIEKLAIGFYKLNKTFLNLQKAFSLQGLHILAQANAWDFVFKIFLFFISNNNFDLRSQLSYVIALIYFSILITFLLKYLKNENKKIKLSILREQQHDAIILVKKILFLFILVGFQKEPIIQCLLLSSIILFYLAFVVMIKLINSDFSIKILLWNEVPILLFTLSSLMYCVNFLKFTNEEQQILFGFIQISLLIIGLFGSFYRHLAIFISEIKFKLIQKCKKPQPLAPIILNPNKMFTVEK